MPGRRGWLHVVLLCLLGLPFSYYLAAATLGWLGPDPGNVMMEGLGEWAMIFLLGTLAVSPLNRLLGNYSLIRYRRTLGLTAFVYGGLHILAYFTFILGLSLTEFVSELLARPYIYVGLVAMSILLTLALTSNQISRRVLKRSWKRLHRLVYLAIILVLWHYLWQLRALSAESMLYVFIAAFLLLIRLYWKLKSRSGSLSAP